MKVSIQCILYICRAPMIQSYVIWTANIIDFTKWGLMSIHIFHTHTHTHTHIYIVRPCGALATLEHRVRPPVLESPRF